jgi:hypothetical protein
MMNWPPFPSKEAAMSGRWKEKEEVAAIPLEAATGCT